MSEKKKLVMIGNGMAGMRAIEENRKALAVLCDAFSCHIDDRPVAAARTVHAGDRMIAVFRLTDDRVKAVENRCQPFITGV